MREIYAPPPGPVLVVGDAKLMTDDERAFLTEFQGFLITDHDIDYRVVTVDDAGDINRFTSERFAKLFANSPSAGGRGLLLVVDPTRDRVRLEVAFVLEGTFPMPLSPMSRTGRWCRFFAMAASPTASSHRPS